MTKRLVDVDDTLYHDLKVYAASNDITVRACMDRAIRGLIYGPPIDGT